MDGFFGFVFETRRETEDLPLSINNAFQIPQSSRQPGTMVEAAAILGRYT